MGGIGGDPIPTRILISYLLADEGIVITVTRSNERRQRGRRGISHDGTRLQLMKSMFANVYVNYIYYGVYKHRLLVDYTHSVPAEEL